ncbi:MAG: FtsX-like permease family protein [Alphaproteobacteria bacterium]|jgi:cell division transport system permease protein
MIPRRGDLPLGGDANRRFIPLIVGAMVYLAALALAGTFALDRTVQQWSDGLRGALTVQLPGVAQDPEGAEAQTRIDTAVAMLRETAGILSARPLPHAQAQALLEPWLGAGDLPENLAIPIIVDVTIDPASRLNFEDLAQRLEDTIPGARLSDNGVFLQRLVTLARVVQLVGGVVVLIVGIATVSIVVFATRAGMTSHRDTIELLHLIGARDRYIARRFVAHALWYGLLGGVIGLILATLTLVALALAAQGVDDTVLPRLSLGLTAWVALLCVPIVSAVIAMITARITVMRALRRLP